MGVFEIFVIRVGISIMFAFLICRFFFQSTPVVRVFGLAFVLLGVAYVLEYVRKRNRRGSHED